MNTSSADSSLVPRPRACVLTCSGILLGLGLAILLGYVLLWGVGALLVTSDPLKPAEALVLLSGGDTQRAEEVVRIYRQVGANVVLLTKAEGSRAEDWNADWLISKGIPAEVIHITSKRASSTYEEARFTRETLEALGVKSCIVITDPYHTLRARLIFNSVYRGSGIKLSVRAVQGHWYRSPTWMFSRQGWDVTVSELIKMIAYLMGVRGD